MSPGLLYDFFVGYILLKEQIKRFKDNLAFNALSPDFRHHKFVYRVPIILLSMVGNHELCFKTDKEQRVLWGAFTQRQTRNQKFSGQERFRGIRALR